MDWNEIENDLKDMKVEPGADKEAFWADFRARAELINQDGESPVEASYNPGWVRWAVILSCIVIVAALVFHFSQSPVTQDKEGYVGPAEKDKPTQVAKNEILELEIIVSHDGCIIMEEEETTLIMIYPPEEE